MISYPPHTCTSSSSSPRPSPRQLQGPRPTPLKVRKDSYKIDKKAPAAAAAAVPPNNPNPLANPPPQQVPRPPVIIYTVSPKIIHTNPSDFMTLVQRLTGPDSLDSPSARFAAIQTADKFSSPKPQQQQVHVDDDGDGDGSSSVNLMVERGASASASTTGILSPMPSSLLPISSSFFFSPMSMSMSFDAAGTFGFLQEDLIPGPNAGFLISPTTTPTVPSPGAPAWDHIFNHF